MIRSLFIRWLVKGLIFISLIVAIFAVLLVLLPVDQSSYFAALLDKHKLLESTPSPRVIMVGGSSIAMGQDSEWLAAQLKKPVVHDGLHAGLGMRFILNDLAPFLHSGDVVVLVPEYQNFFGGLDGDDSTLELLMDVYPQAIQSLEAPQYVMISDIYITMLRSRLLRLANLVISHSETENIIYSRAGFNHYGDFIGHLGEISDPNLDDTFDSMNSSYNPAAIDVFNRFARQAKAKGANVVMVYPPLRMSNCLVALARLEKLDSYLRNHLDFPILSHPRDSCFANEFFLRYSISSKC